MCQEETEGEERFAGLIDGGGWICPAVKVGGSVQALLGVGRVSGWSCSVSGVAWK